MNSTLAYSSDSPQVEYRQLFAAAFGESGEPYAWQQKLAEGDWPEVLIAPTGSGKTAGITLAWLYRRLCRPDRTARRLVWCLPMRSLVDQIHEEIRMWLKNIEAADLDRHGALPGRQDVHVLMGGMDSGMWFEAPESPAIILGTQDMILSRALMRGYASSRAIWPMEFGVMHFDSLFVFDEVQLMQAGLATSTQLEAFRRQDATLRNESERGVGRPSRSLWTSATLLPEWLETVDHPAPTKVFSVEPTTESDNRLRKLSEATKYLQKARCAPGSPNAKDQRSYIAQLAGLVVEAHRRGHITLVILNQVKRAQDLYAKVQSVLVDLGNRAPSLVLLHSRFRLADRKREMDRLMHGGSDVIVIATQAVEAGMDLSAAVMFTELAPWSSMVQRFGRVNRYAEVEGGARVYWIDLLGSASSDGKSAERMALPYTAEHLAQAYGILSDLGDVAPVFLPAPRETGASQRVLRRKDLYDLFDTDADLTGFDIDISAYVRDADDTDVRVSWRDLSVAHDAPPILEAHSFCAVPIGQARNWLNGLRKLKSTQRPLLFARDPQWRRDSDQSRPNNPPGWCSLRALRPGMTILADISTGGYHEELGFTGNPKHVPVLEERAIGPIVPSTVEGESEGHDEDPRSSAGRPVLLADHLRHVVQEVNQLCAKLAVDAPTRQVLARAAQWHDLGKAHAVFQDTMRRGLEDGCAVPEGALLAKTKRRQIRHARAYFRHELASALAILAHEAWSLDANLVAYLIAAHHGKVRMNLRALPREAARRNEERNGRRFARGVWEGDELPPVSLGPTERWQRGSLSLSIMELGWDETTQQSWTERTRGLLLRHGPFRLAWLETLLRLADWRASEKEELGGYDDE